MFCTFLHVGVAFLHVADDPANVNVNIDQKAPYPFITNNLAER